MLVFIYDHNKIKKKVGKPSQIFIFNHTQFLSIRNLRLEGIFWVIISSPLQSQVSIHATTISHRSPEQHLLLHILHTAAAKYPITNQKPKTLQCATGRDQERLKGERKPTVLIICSLMLSIGFIMLVPLTETNQRVYIL